MIYSIFHVEQNYYTYYTYKYENWKTKYRIIESRENEIRMNEIAKTIERKRERKASTEKRNTSNEMNKTECEYQIEKLNLVQKNSVSYKQK